MSLLFPQWLFSKTVNFDHFNDTQLALLKDALAEHEIEITACNAQLVKFYIPLVRNVTNWNLMVGYENGVITLDSDCKKNSIHYELTYMLPMIMALIWMFPMVVLWFVTVFNNGNFNFRVPLITVSVTIIFAYFLKLFRQKLYFNWLVDLLEKNKNRYHEEV